MVTQALEEGGWQTDIQWEQNSNIMTLAGRSTLANLAPTAASPSRVQVNAAPPARLLNTNAQQERRGRWAVPPVDRTVRR
ncbi:hypothetical protein SKAU_G00071970 [Synaphobranchus kaupii]|uniref:Uncharacterized protein n=1 Tax=Synaphobranchus kaupii TaxID=118154 RepID=A0A9Q1G810_SYNKA|nr:hypothetical protein SKAU_G00071970 [Synaphobranchus kaupii]